MKKIILAVLLCCAINPCIGTIAIGASITLSWDAPTTNEDGTQLTDLAGYKIYYSKISGIYDKLLVVDAGNVLTKTLVNFCDGIYYFVATAYDTSGNESKYSNEVSKTIKIAHAEPINLR